MARLIGEKLLWGKERERERERKKKVREREGGERERRETEGEDDELSALHRWHSSVGNDRHAEMYDPAYIKASTLLAPCCIMDNIIRLRVHIILSCTKGA